MNRHNSKHLKQQSFERVSRLARDGQIPLAIVMWNRHMSQFEGCVCETKLLDRTLCGFCLLSRMQSEGLAYSSRCEADSFLDAAEDISRFLMARRSTPFDLAAE